MRSWIREPTLVVVAWAAGCGVDSAIPVAELAPGPFDVTLAIPGELEAVRSASMSVPDMQGQAKVEWVIDEGARVEAGEVVVRFEESALVEALEKAQGELEVALTKIEQRKAQLDVRLGDLANEVTNSELALRRAEMRVTDSETVPRVERESARLDVQGASIAVERSKASLESARLEGEAELELLELDVARARRELASAEQSRQRAVLSAPAPGIVILPPVWKGGSEGPIAAGDSVWRGMTIVELPDLSEMRVVAWVHEVDAAKVAVDQPVRVVIDAHPDPAHPGKVARVADLAVRRDPEKTVKHLEVGVALDATTSVMKPGMTVRAEVQVEHLDEALAVPREAVFVDDEGPYVFVRGFGGFDRARVTLGTSNDTHAVVTSGLEAGDVVALVDPDAAGEPARPGAPASPAASDE